MDDMRALHKHGWSKLLFIAWCLGAGLVLGVAGCGTVVHGDVCGPQSCAATEVCAADPAAAKGFLCSPIPPGCPPASRCACIVEEVTLGPGCSCEDHGDFVEITCPSQ